MICSDPDAFFAELGEILQVVGQEVRPSEMIADRIDILALDRDATTVIVELKRGSHKLQLLQAISYAGMISHWSGERFAQALAAHTRQTPEDSQIAIEEHAGADISAINQRQRILLIAEDFDPALLLAAEWLYENFSVDIRCHRLQLSQENGNDYLTCTCVYPPVEIASLARRVGQPINGSASLLSWSEILKSIENAAVANFFENEIHRGLESRPRYREIIYRTSDKRRFWVSARSKYAYVRQRGRFRKDVTYWQSRLSQAASIGETHDGRSLRFRLETAEDFKAFVSAVRDDLRTAEFSETCEAAFSAPG